jgi:A/G-specific adenine glycosylase
MDDRWFINQVWDHYRFQGRTFSWRTRISPYRVHVSEMMLQQTQTKRVEPAFERFLVQFPDYPSLAQASLSEVIANWQGLGYNRRARFLKQAAEMIVSEYQCILPTDESSLRRLPGIGPNTAASILAFAFNLPTVFIETNIRSVFLHHYFPQTVASDRQILPLVAQTLDQSRPREWYWALMDYGVHIKKTVGNESRRSTHHIVQSRFAGSVRQVRGEILRALLESQAKGELLDDLELSCQILSRLPKVEETSHKVRYDQALTGLLRDGMVAEQEGRYRLPD